MRYYVSWQRERSATCVPFVENDPEIDRIGEEERIRSGIRSGSSLDRVAVSPFVYSLRPTTKTTGSPPLFPRRNHASSTLVHRRLTPARFSFSRIVLQRVQACTISGLTLRCIKWSDNGSGRKYSNHFFHKEILVISRHFVRTTEYSNSGKISNIYMYICIERIKV